MGHWINRHGKVQFKLGKSLSPFFETISKNGFIVFKRRLQLENYIGFNSSKHLSPISHEEVHA